jgi:hypothetical protein
VAALAVAIMGQEEKSCCCLRTQKKLHHRRPRQPTNGSFPLARVLVRGDISVPGACGGVRTEEWSGVVRPTSCCGQRWGGRQSGGGVVHDVLAVGGGSF